METFLEFFTDENIEIIKWAVGGLFGFLFAVSEALGKIEKTKHNGVLSALFGFLKNLKGKNVAPMLLIMALVLPSITGCALTTVKPEQPGEVLAAVESDYATALIAAKAAYDAGALSTAKAGRIDALRNEIGPMLDRAYFAFAQGSTMEGNEWVKLAVPLVTKLLLEVPQ